MATLTRAERLAARNAKREELMQTSAATISSAKNSPSKRKNAEITEMNIKKSNNHDEIYMPPRKKRKIIIYY